MIYTGVNTREISFPLGGIGSGCVGLAGNGRLVDWEIFNHPGKFSFNGMSHFAVRAQKNGKVIDARILNGDLQPPYSGTYSEKLFNGFGWGPSRNNLCGMPHFREHEFNGEFPVAEITFREPDFPGAAKLCAWSPMIPGNACDSSIPAACFEIEVANCENETIEYSVVGVLSSPFTHQGSKNIYYSDRDTHQLILKSGLAENDFEYGELSLSTGFPDVSCQEYWYRGPYVDDLEVYWNDMMRPGRVCLRQYACRENSGGKPDTGLLETYFHLAPGETRKVIFVLTWNLPNLRNSWNPEADKLAEKNGVKNRWRNWYATVWKDAAHSGAYVLRNYEGLREGTFRFHDALFSSTLPQEVIDGVSANISILKSPTCLRLEDGTFYGWEGVGVKAGSCEGSCTHVWNYAQALPFLFPELERSMRESHYNFSQDKDGGCHFRIMLPLGIKADTGFMRPCVDGQFGDVMKTYRDWKICGDDMWLKKLWPAVKKSIEFAWSDKNYDLWDPAQNGVIEGRQHHTLDMELFGPNVWLTGHYLGALKAAAEMADAMGESDFASHCRNVFSSGKKWIEINLFNGEYYFQKINLKDKKVLEKFSGSGKDSAVDAYWSAEHEEIKYQIGEGCGIDTHLPQWYASLYGIGEVLDSGHVTASLKSIFKYNYKSSMRDVPNPWRNYALNDETGTLICVWPEGTPKPVIPIRYASETMHGFEWAAACHMIMKGMVKEGMEIVKSIRLRYDGEKRNPWNEFECGSNYARSMASYALLNAFCGFCFDLRAGMIGFAPILKDPRFCCFWSLGTVWGRFERSEGTDRIHIDYGHICLHGLNLEPGIIKLECQGNSLRFTEIEGRLFLKNALELSAGAVLIVIR
jgi:non-lysosomal glucosylceramidase